MILSGNIFLLALNVAKGSFAQQCRLFFRVGDWQCHFVDPQYWLFGLLVPALFLHSIVVFAEEPKKETIGNTYPVIEPDALKEIEDKVAVSSFDPKVFGDEKDWSAVRSRELPDAEEDATRYVVPFFTLTFDIQDQNGKIIYPKGYIFNPLEYQTLPQRLFIVSDEFISWAIEFAEVGDMILLSGGNALEATRSYGRTIFKLEDRVQERFQLQVVPSIVRQDGTRLVIKEFLIKKEKDLG